MAQLEELLDSVESSILVNPKNELQRLRTVGEITNVSDSNGTVYRASTVARTMRQHPEIFDNKKLSSLKQWIDYCFLPRRTALMSRFIAALRNFPDSEIHGYILSKEGANELHRLMRYPEIEEFKDDYGNAIFTQSQLRSAVQHHPQFFQHKMGWTIKEAVQFYLDSNYKKTRMLSLMQSFRRQSATISEYLDRVGGTDYYHGLRNASAILYLKDDNDTPPYNEDVIRSLISRNPDIFRNPPFFSLAQLVEYGSRGPLKSNKARLIKAILNYNHRGSNGIVYRMLDRDLWTIKGLAADRGVIHSLDAEGLAGFYIAYILESSGIKSILSPGYNPLSRTPLEDNLGSVVSFLKSPEPKAFWRKIIKYAAPESLDGQNLTEEDLGMFNLQYKEISNLKGSQLWFIDLLAGLEQGPETLKRIFAKPMESEMNRIERAKYKIAELVILSQFPVAFRKGIELSLASINPAYLSRGGLFVYRLASHYFMPARKKV